MLQVLKTVPNSHMYKEDSLKDTREENNCHMIPTGIKNYLQFVQCSKVRPPAQVHDCRKRDKVMNTLEMGVSRVQK